MFRFAALNSPEAREESHSQQGQPSSIEVQVRQHRFHKNLLSSIAVRIVEKINLNETKVYKLYQDAVQLHHHQRFTEAEERYKEIIAIFTGVFKTKAMQDLPSLRRVRYLALKNLGDLEMKARRLPDALVHLAEALDIDGEDIMVWKKLGEIARDVGNYSVARYAFATAVSKQPRHWISISNLVDVLYLLGDYEGMAQVIETVAFRLDPNWPRGHELLAHIGTKTAHFQSTRANGGIGPWPRPKRQSIGSDVELLSDLRRKRQKTKELEKVKEVSVHIRTGTWKSLTDALKEVCRSYLASPATAATPGDAVAAEASSLHSPVVFVLDPSIDTEILQFEQRKSLIEAIAEPDAMQDVAAVVVPDESDAMQVVAAVVPEAEVPAPDEEVNDLTPPPVIMDLNDATDTNDIDNLPTDVIPTDFAEVEQIPVADEVMQIDRHQPESLIDLTDDTPKLHTDKDGEGDLDEEPKFQPGDQGLDGTEPKSEAAAEPTVVDVDAMETTAPETTPKKEAKVETKPRRSSRVHKPASWLRRASGAIEAHIEREPNKFEIFLQSIINAYKTVHNDTTDLSGIYEQSAAKGKSKPRRKASMNGTSKPLAAKPFEAIDVKQFAESLTGATLLTVLQRLLVVLSTECFSKLTWTTDLVYFVSQIHKLTKSVTSEELTLTELQIRLCLAELQYQHYTSLPSADPSQAGILSQSKALVETLLDYDFESSNDAALTALALRTRWLWGNLLERGEQYKQAWAEYEKCAQLFQASMHQPIQISGLNDALGQISTESLETKLRTLDSHSKFDTAERLFKEGKYTELVALCAGALDQVDLPSVGSLIEPRDPTKPDAPASAPDTKLTNVLRLAEMLVKGYGALRANGEPSTEALTTELKCFCQLLTVSLIDSELLSKSSVDEMIAGAHTMSVHGRLVGGGLRWSVIRLTLLNIRRIRSQSPQSSPTPRAIQYLVLLFHFLTADEAIEKRQHLRYLHLLHNELKTTEKCYAHHGIVLKTTIAFLEKVKAEEVDEPDSDESSQDSKKSPEVIEVKDETQSPRDGGSVPATAATTPVPTVTPPPAKTSDEELLTHAFALRQCYACLYQIALPDPNIPKAELEPHKQDTKRSTKRPAKTEMYKLFTFLRPFIEEIVGLKSKPARLLASYYDALSSVNRAFRSLYPSADLTKAEGLVDDYLTGKTPELATLPITDETYRDVVENIFYLRGTMQRLKEKKAGKQKDKSEEDIEAKAQAKYKIQLAFNPSHSECWAAIAVEFFKKFSKQAAEVSEAIWRGDKTIAKSVEEVNIKAIQTERCLARSVGMADSTGDLSAMSELGRLYFQRGKFETHFQRTQEAGVDYTKPLELMTKAASCFKTICLTLQHPRWQHTFMYGRCIESVLRLQKNKQQDWILSWTAPEATPVTPAVTQLVTAFTWQDCLDAYSKTVTEQLGTDKRLGEPLYRLHSLRLTLATKILVKWAEAGNMLNSDQAALLKVLEEHNFVPTELKLRRAHEPATIQSLLANASIQTGPNGSRERLSAVIHNSLDALLYCDAQVVKFKTGKPQYRMAKFFMTMEPEVLRPFADPERAINELKQIFQLKRSSLAIWVFWRQPEIDPYEMPGKSTYDHRRYLHLFAQLLHAFQDVENFETVINKIPRWNLSDLFAQYFKLFIELQRQLIEAADVLDAVGGEKLLVRVFQTRREFQNSRSPIDKTKLDELVAQAYIKLIKRDVKPIPADRLPATIEEALAWAGNSRPDLLAPEKKKKPKAATVATPTTAAAAVPVVSSV